MRRAERHSSPRPARCGAACCGAVRRGHDWAGAPSRSGCGRRRGAAECGRRRLLAGGPAPHRAGGSFRRGARRGGRPGRRLGHAEILEPVARLGRGLPFGVLIQIGLVGLGRVRIARLLPVALVVKLFESRLCLGREFSARIFLQELLVRLRCVALPGFLPVALLPAAAGEAMRVRNSTQVRIVFWAFSLLAAD